jgi:hypothetical protein
LMTKSSPFGGDLFILFAWKLTKIPAGRYQSLPGIWMSFDLTVFQSDADSGLKAVIL